MGMTLSSRQLFWMMVSMQLIMTLLLTANLSFKLASQDAWISAIIATAEGVAIAYVCTKLSMMFPGRTLIEFTRELAGRWVGNAISVLYLLLWIGLFGIILQQFSIFIVATILPSTPPIVIVLLMVGVVLFLSLHGIDAIARCCELLGPLIMIGVIFPVLFAINRMDTDHLLPVYIDNGISRVMQGGLPIATFLGDCILLMMLIAFVRTHKKVVRHAVIGVLVTGLFTVLTVFACLLIFGFHASQGYPYPMLQIVRSLSLSNVIENLDAVLVSVWIMSVFTKLTLYLFISSYGTAQLFGAKNWRIFAWLIALVGLAVGLIPLNYVESSMEFPMRVAVPYVFPTLMTSVPVLLWLVALVKRRISSGPS